MRKFHFTRFLTLCFAVFLLFSITACNEQHDILEEPDITVEYLSGDYAEQLLRDGGENTLGTISLVQNEDDTYSLTVNSMLIVENDDGDLGYYIADKNISSAFQLDPEARVTYIKENGADPEIIDLTEFINLVQNDTSDPLEEGNEKLYNVYTMNDNVLMILAEKMPEKN